MEKFGVFFEDPIYLLYKNYLYNYLVRRWVIRKNLAANRFKTVLELGCGISPVLKLSKQVIWTDLSWRALAFLRKGAKKNENPPVVASDATRLPFRDGSLDGVVCSEVIEHIEKDDEALDEISRTLAPRGLLFLTCPIHPRYFGFDDELVGHYRRYEIHPLMQRLEERGFGEFRILPILGLFEKQLMEKIARLYALLKKGGEEKRLLSGGIRVAALVLFPFYFLLNYFLAFCVHAQARLVPMKHVVTVGIRCRKRD